MRRQTDAPQEPTLDKRPPPHSDTSPDHFVNSFTKS